MKITLATLEQATAQQVFDQVASHLLSQNERSINQFGDCNYRGLNNRTCAAGCLIAEDEYDPKMERNGWYTMVLEEYVQTDKHRRLISDLQFIHDQYTPDNWLQQLSLLGRQEKLDISVLDSFTVLAD